MSFKKYSRIYQGSLLDEYTIFTKFCLHNNILGSKSSNIFARKSGRRMCAQKFFGERMPTKYFYMCAEAFDDTGLTYKSRNFQI